tara:strand:- start:32933 stop:33259 length:327 start_codon:yes stop_codon:yes gene_type:complete
VKISTLRKIVRTILREEIGRNYHTIDNDPYSWEDYPGISVDVYPMGNGQQWYSQVTVEFDDNLSTPLRIFASEEDAQNFARQNVEKANRERLSKNIDTGTPAVSDIEY